MFKRTKSKTKIEGHEIQLFDLGCLCAENPAITSINIMIKGKSLTKTRKEAKRVLNKILQNQFIVNQLIKLRDTEGLQYEKLISNLIELTEGL